MKNILTWWHKKKFDIAIKSIFVFAVIVSFSHTMLLYDSVGFDSEVTLLNHLFGVKWFTLSLFATISCEMAFAVGLWGLYDSYEKESRFPTIRNNWHTWILFGSGLLIVGWSNIGGTVGYNYLVGNPIKGIILGISIPLFVLGTVLVNFQRKHTRTDHTEEVTHAHTHISHTVNHTHTQPSHTEGHTHSRAQQKQEAPHAPHTQREQAEEVAHTTHTAFVDSSHTVEESHTETELSHVAHTHNEDSHTHTSHTEEEVTHTPHTHDDETRTESVDFIDPVDPHTYAINYYRENGEYPSIRGMASELNISEWNVRKILDPLKKKEKKAV